MNMPWKSKLSALVIFCVPFAVPAQGWISIVDPAARVQVGGEIPIFLHGFEAPESGPCIPAYPNGFVVSWNGTYGNPWPSYNAALLAYPPFEGVLSLAFTPAPMAEQFGTVITFDFQGDARGLAQLSISAAPGCFRAPLLQPNCLSPVAIAPELDWSNSPISDRCWLTPGQTYYLNLTFGGTPAPGMPGCPLGGCATELRNVRR